jgi:hypothetical protein
LEKASNVIFCNRIGIAAYLRTFTGRERCPVWQCVPVSKFLPGCGSRFRRFDALFLGLGLTAAAQRFQAACNVSGDVCGTELLTAVAWLSFFFGLKWLEPAVVATLYKPSLGEWLCYVKLAGVLAALVFVVLTDRSGVAESNPFVQGGALLAVAVGGVTITISHLIVRWFNDRGVGSDAVTGTRFLLTFCTSAASRRQ